MRDFKFVSEKSKLINLPIVVSNAWSDSMNACKVVNVTPLSNQLSLVLSFHDWQPGSFVNPLPSNLQVYKHFVGLATDGFLPSIWCVCVFDSRTIQTFRAVLFLADGSNLLPEKSLPGSSTHSLGRQRQLRAPFSGRYQPNGRLSSNSVLLVFFFME